MLWLETMIRSGAGQDYWPHTEQALAEAAAGTIAPVIGQVFPLEQAGQAHAAIEARTVFGKTLLTMT